MSRRRLKDKGMAKKVDMHLHTTYSDGLLSPEKMVEHCFSKGITEMAITDHDSVGGVVEGEITAKKFGIKFHRGVEISTFMKFEKGRVGIHLLGYDIDIENKKLREIFRFLKKDRQESNEKVFSFVERDFNISKEEIIKSKNTDYIGKPDIGRVLVSKGFFKDLDQAFKEYFSKGEIGKIHRGSVEIERAIEAVSESGGYSVLAHPAFIKVGEKGSRERFDAIENIVREARDKGVTGIEAMYFRNTGKETEFLCNLAQRENMIITQGSDYHG